MAFTLKLCVRAPALRSTTSGNSTPRALMESMWFGNFPPGTLLVAIISNTLSHDIISGESMSLTPGSRLGPYEILELIGAGGMGEVWKARDTRLDRLVAIKTSQVGFSDRFEREARSI